MYRFQVFHRISGDFLNEYPMDIESDLTRFLKMFGEGTLSLPLFNGRGKMISDTWEQDILPQRSLILVLDDRDRIVWHGTPEDRLRSSDGASVRFPCKTEEAYLIRRYMPTRNFEGVDQARIFQSLLETTTTGGIGLDYDCPDTGVIRDRAYNDDENATVYDRANELAAVGNGFDWTIDVEWANDAHTKIRKVARTGYPHLGNRDANPVHVFETGRNLKGWASSEPWGADDAATHVTAVGDGEGASKVMSAPIIDTVREAAGWPRLEVRESFSGVKEQQTIDDHAFALATYLFGGQEVVSFEAKNPGIGEDFTRLGDLTLGDTARLIINTPQLTREAVWPVVGWSLSPSTGIYKPVLAKIGGAASG